MKSKVELLTEYFREKQIEEETISLLVNKFEFRKYDLGETILSMGERTDTICLILKGLVRGYYMDEIGRIDILVNNAGFSIRSAMEEYDICQMKQMYDVNVLGSVRMIQAVLPYMRKQKCGKILNIGSISGRMTGIVNGGYCSTKYAVEAITEATRYEVADKGIQVSVIEPGAMETDFFKTLAKNSDAFMMNTNSPYFDLYQRDLAFRKKQKRAPIEVCATQIVRIIEKPKLKVRYTIAVSWMYQLFTHMPDGLKEFIIKRVN